MMLAMMPHGHDAATDLPLRQIMQQNLLGVGMAGSTLVRLQILCPQPHL